MAFRFVHIADIHLDSPLRSLALRNADLSELIGDASRQAFKLFGEMAKVGQVIYLTHHQHLCDIAKKVVPGATVHEL